MANDVQYLIDMLYEMIDGAKGVLMSPDKCIIVRKEIGRASCRERV